MGQVPVLEIDGKKVHQTIPICRFLANRFGLAGNSDLENLEIDSVVETVNDLRASKFSLYLTFEYFFSFCHRNVSGRL